MKQFQVVIKELATDKEVKVIPCSGERQAEQVERGVLRQLDRERYVVFTRLFLVSDPDEKKAND